MTNRASDYIKLLAGILSGLIFYVFSTKLTFSTPSSFLFAQSILAGTTYFLFGLQLSPFNKNTNLTKIFALVFLSCLFILVNYYLFDPYLFKEEHRQIGINIKNNNIDFSNLSNFTKFLRVAFIPQYLLSSYILYIFYCAYIDDSENISFYHKLFRHSWRVIFTVTSFAPLFSLLIWLLIYLISSTFSLLNISIIKNIISMPIFIYLATAGFYALGIILVDHNQFVIDKMRDILLSISKILYPIFAIAALIFMATGTLLSPLPFSSYYWIFIIIAFFHILLYNGIFQAGIKERPYNKILTNIILLFVFIMPFYLLASIVQTYAMLKIANPIPVFDLGTKIFFMYLFFLFFYTAGYAIAIFMPQKKYWCEFSSKANVTVSFGGALVFLLTIFLWGH